MKEHKYVKHSDKQRSLILETAEQLFMEYEIKEISMSRIAQECGITRATLYRYFENRDEIVWEIYIHFSEKTLGSILERIREPKFTTCEKMAIYLRGLVDIYLQMPEYYKFFFHFSKEYLNNQLYPDTEYTRELYETTGMTSGAMVGSLVENFEDGSVREGLKKTETGISVVYGALGALQIICGNSDAIPVKYGVPAIDVLVAAMNTLLQGVRNENYHSALVEHIWEGIQQEKLK